MTTQHTLDQKQTPARGQTRTRARHEDLRCVAALTSPQRPGGSHPVKGCYSPTESLQLTLDDVVYLKHLGLAGIYAQLGQNGHEALTERVELRLRVPDLADVEVVVRTGAQFVVEPVCGRDSGLGETPDSFVVLLGRQ